jgi:hypothetical protein
MEIMSSQMGTVSSIWRERQVTAIVRRGQLILERRCCTDALTCGLEGTPSVAMSGTPLPGSNGSPERRDRPDDPRRPKNSSSRSSRNNTWTCSSAARRGDRTAPPPRRLVGPPRTRRRAPHEQLASPRRPEGAAHLVGIHRRLLALPRDSAGAENETVEPATPGT